MQKWKLKHLIKIIVILEIIILISKLIYPINDELFALRGTFLIRLNIYRDNFFVLFYYCLEKEKKRIKITKKLLL